MKYNYKSFSEDDIGKMTEFLKKEYCQDKCFRWKKHPCLKTLKQIMTQRKWLTEIYAKYTQKKNESQEQRITEKISKERKYFPINVFAKNSNYLIVRKLCLHLESVTTTIWDNGY